MYARCDGAATTSRCCVVLPLLLLFAILLQPTAGNSNPTAYDASPIESEAHHEYTTDASRRVWPWKSYRTSKHNPPELNITRNRGALSKDYIFLSPTDSHSHDGTYDQPGTGFVMNSYGDLIYAADDNGMDFCNDWVAGITDFRVQEYNGKKYITYWNGCNTKGRNWGYRWGRVTFIDEEYQKFVLNPDLNINTRDPATRGNIDMHEHEMTDSGSMVVTSFNNTQFDLTAQGGPADGWIADGMIFDIDLKTEKVLFQWRALDHLPINASHFGLGKINGEAIKRDSWDWIHINSVQKVGDDYLISCRHHHAIYMISGKDGSVLWKLDGQNGGDFGRVPLQFSYQHHARAHNVTENGMTVSFFNNRANNSLTDDVTKDSSGVAFWLPLPPNKDNPPVLVRNLQSPGEILTAGTQGSYQMDLGNGNGFLCYGIIPIMREYDVDGKLLWQAQFGERHHVKNYRAFKQEWHGTPRDWNPIAFIENPRQHIPRVYVSWNGATDISGWAVFAGQHKYSLEPVGMAQKKAFETVFELERDVQCVQVGAIRDGEMIRRSNIACLSDDDGHAEQSESDKVTLDDTASGSTPETVADPATDPVYNRLQEENARLKAELEELQRQTWARYEEWSRWAMAVIVLTLVVCCLVCIRGWRRRGRYAPVKHDIW